MLDRVADLLADLLTLLPAGRAQALLASQFVGLLDDGQMLHRADVAPPARAQATRRAARSACDGRVLDSHHRRLGGNRLLLELLCELQQQLAGIAQAVGPRAIGLLEQLRQAQLQPQLLELVVVALLGQCADRDLMLRDDLLALRELLLVGCDDLRMRSDDLLALAQQRLEAIHFVLQHLWRPCLSHRDVSINVGAARLFQCDCIFLCFIRHGLALPGIVCRASRWPGRCHPAAWPAHWLSVRRWRGHP